MNERQMLININGVYCFLNQWVAEEDHNLCADCEIIGEDLDEHPDFDPEVDEHKPIAPKFDCQEHAIQWALTHRF